MEIPSQSDPAYILSSAPDVFTIDVEDWFHILEVAGAPNLTEWDSLPSHVESNFMALLDLLAEWDVRATCFVLGRVAKRFPKLIREAAERGHDIASHGHSHQNVRVLSRAEFRDDIRTAKAAIEDAIGGAVFGYRAPGFSITQGTPWAFEEIIEVGYTFDSSVFPAHHGHGGMPESPRHPHLISSGAGHLIEFPVTIANTPFGPQCFFGGGYLRLFPLWLIEIMAKSVRTEGRGVVWYIHPREIDPDHPRMQMSLKRSFKSYVNLGGTIGKLNAILRQGNFATFGELVARFSEAKQGNL